MDDVTYLIFPMALSGFWVLALMGIALVYGNSERVVKYQGQTLLEVDKGFLDPWYSCYAYCGPLVRGTERVQGGPTPIDGDSN